MSKVRSRVGVTPKLRSRCTTPARRVARRAGAAVVASLLLTVVFAAPGSAVNDPRGANRVFEAPDYAGDPAAPVVALTFDDGPHPEFTPQILDILDGQGREGDVLPGRPGGGAPPRPRAPDRGRGPHHRQPHLEPRPPARACPRSVHLRDRPHHRGARGDLRPGRGLHPPALRRRRARHRRAPRRPRPGQHRVERRLPRLREARRPGPSSTTPSRASGPAASSCCTTAAATATRPSPPSPSSSTPSAAAGTRSARCATRDPTARRATSTASRPTRPSRSTWWAGRKDPDSADGPTVRITVDGAVAHEGPANGTRGDGHPGIDITLPVAPGAAPRLRSPS